MNYKSLKEKLSPKLAKALEDLKAELVDIGFTKHKGEMTVSVYIYKKEGLDIDLLQKATDRLNPIFDSVEELKDKYYLEI